LSSSPDHAVLVQVVSSNEGRQIEWGSNLAERLADRMDDITGAITEGVHVVTQSLRQLPSTEHWTANEVTVTFGITLTAEAGVILSKASAETSFEVSVTLKREQVLSEDVR
jgi:hypothetical protein